MQPWHIGGGVEALPAHMHVLHYGVDAGPSPPVPDQQLELSSCSTNTPQQRHLPVPGTDPVGMLQPMGASEEAQGRTVSLLLSDSKSVPVTNLSTKVNAQTTCTDLYTCIDLLQDDSGHFVQGCFSLLTFRDPKLLNHDGVSKGITWRAAGQFSTQQSSQRKSILWQAYSSVHGMYTHLHGAKQRYGVSAARITAPTGQAFGSRGWWCAKSVSSSSQHQVQSGHKFSITDTFCNFSISFFEAGNVSVWFTSCFSFPTG